MLIQHNTRKEIRQNHDAAEVIENMNGFHGMRFYSTNTNVIVLGQSHEECTPLPCRYGYHFIVHNYHPLLVIAVQYSRLDDAV